MSEKVAKPGCLSSHLIQVSFDVYCNVCWGHFAFVALFVELVLIKKNLID